MGNKITDIVSKDNQKIKFDCTGTISEGLIQLAAGFPDEIIVWCHSNYKEHLALEKISTLFHHNKMMLSFRPKSNNFFDHSIGYIEESLFINVNKKVSYPTWQMSSYVGVIHASVLNAISDKIVCELDLDYYLHSLAKLCLPLGLLCYSEPQLLKSAEIIDSLVKAPSFTLFRFVKQHYKTRWVFLLALNLLLYERKILLYPFISAFFYKRRFNNKINIDDIVVQSSRAIIDKGTIDVIIPTIGRKAYLYDVLKDFSKQSLLPQRIIIVEQNPEPFSKSELDYLATDKWPFEIQHVFTHQAGACNARNLALTQTRSEWVFLADDDIRISGDFLEKSFKHIKKFGEKAVSFCCLQKNEKPTFNNVFQWVSFGSGCSIVANDILKDCSFNLGYEYGYGEDSDFGMQLRNQGNDVLFLPEPSILHLKAPVGGFRTKPILKWQDEVIQPKPSPTVMLYLMMHNTKQQILGYKTILFFKFYKHQKIKNPFQYFVVFNKQWKQSIFWANQLKIDS
ncbi:MULTISPECIES: glycosyltransferase family 2 protein [unclassified Flavobacterium]|uniref:glycosyltransferase family 2 protein n=1 Tax=unclassified Flavobacterium TaxID=196869 RepID=UPI001E2B47BC|nr:MULTISPECIES: glycosyltransferase family A protein [unclassified Flavobacterium]